jgi:hypothetical protein
MTTDPARSIKITREAKLLLVWNEIRIRRIHVLGRWWKWFLLE